MLISNRPDFLFHHKTATLIPMKTKTHFFKPIAQKGLILHGISIISLLGLVSVLIIPLFNQVFGFMFIAYLLSAILIAIPIPFLVYRSYALFHADYILERDGIRLKWGMRLEDIPMSQIQWIQKASEYKSPIRYPFFSIPGAFIGTVKQKNNLPIEFIASEKKNLVLIGLDHKIYAVSPIEVENFMLVFSEQLEYGSLDEIIPQSIHPSLMITQIFRLPRMSWIILAGFILNLLLLFLSGLASTQYTTVHIGYNVLGMLSEPIPATQLMILPILSLLFFFGSILISGIAYREKSRGKLVYLLQTSNIITCILFLITLVNILQIS